MKNKKLLAEKFNKTEITKIKAIVRKEVDDLKKKDIEKFIQKEIKAAIKSLTIDDIDSNFDDAVEEIFRTMMQKYHEMFYREKHIIKNKLKL